MRLNQSDIGVGIVMFQTHYDTNGGQRRMNCKYFLIFAPGGARVPMSYYNDSHIREKPLCCLK